MALPLLFRSSRSSRLIAVPLQAAVTGHAARQPSSSGRIEALLDLDADISSRMAEASYAAPNNAEISLQMRLSL